MSTTRLKTLLTTFVILLLGAQTFAKPNQKILRAYVNDKGQMLFEIQPTDGGPQQARWLWAPSKEVFYEIPLARQVETTVFDTQHWQFQSNVEPNQLLTIQKGDFYCTPLELRVVSGSRQAKFTALNSEQLSRLALDLNIRFGNSTVRQGVEDIDVVREAFTITTASKKTFRLIQFTTNDSRPKYVLIDENGKTFFPTFESEGPMDTTERLAESSGSATGTYLTFEVETGGALEVVLKRGNEPYARLDIDNRSVEYYSDFRGYADNRAATEKSAAANIMKEIGRLSPSHSRLFNWNGDKVKVFEVYISENTKGYLFYDTGMVAPAEKFKFFAVSAEKAVEWSVGPQHGLLGTNGSTTIKARPPRISTDRSMKLEIASTKGGDQLEPNYYLKASANYDASTSERVTLRDSHPYAHSMSLYEAEALFKRAVPHNNFPKSQLHTPLDIFYPNVKPRVGSGLSLQQVYDLLMGEMGELDSFKREALAEYFSSGKEAIETALLQNGFAQLDLDQQRIVLVTKALKAKSCRIGMTELK